jgi:hypothetical protein
MMKLTGNIENKHVIKKIIYLLSNKLNHSIHRRLFRSKVLFSWRASF